MKKLFTILSALTVALTLKAQSAAIQGQVFLHNSKTRTGTLQTIPGVEIKADSAAPTTSDAQGRFTLRFTSAKDLQQTRITALKHGLVLVNERELFSATIGSEAPIKVFLADSALLAQEQAILYDINLKVLTAEKDRLIAKLRGDSATSAATLAELEERLNREFEHRWAVQDFLEEQLLRMKEQLPERMAGLVRVNLDFASERYVRAYELLKQGQIDLAMRLLDNLDVEATQATGRLEEVLGRQDAAFSAKDSLDNWARQIVASYRLKAEGHNLRFEYRKAAAVLEKGLGLLLRVKRGREDLEIAEIHGDWGSVLRDLGDFESALHHIKLRLEIEKRQQGVDKVSMSTSLNNFAVILIDLGEYQASQKIEREVIGIRETELKQNDPMLAKSYGNLASILLHSGQYSEALGFIKKAIVIYQCDTSIFRLALASVFNCQANILLNLGELGLSLESQMKAIRLVEKEGDMHQRTISNYYNNLALIYREKGAFTESFVQQSKSISILEKLLEENHPELAAGYSNLAAILFDIGDYEKAIPMQERAITIQRIALGPNHPGLAISCNNLATMLQEVGNFEKALIVQGTVIEIQERIFGPQNPDLATSYNNLAMILKHLGKTDKALEVQERAIKVMESVLGSENIRIATFYINKASILSDMGDYGLALEMYQIALYIMEKAVGPSHPSLAAAYNGISFSWFKLGENALALGTQQIAIFILEASAEKHYPHLIVSYQNFREIAIAMREYSLAEEYQWKVISVKVSKIRPEIELADDYHTLSSIQIQTNKLDSALFYENKAYNILIQSSKDTSEVLKARVSLAMCYKAIGDRLLAAGNNMEAMNAYKAALNLVGDEYRILASIGVCYINLHEFQLAIETFEHAARVNKAWDVNTHHFAGYAYAKIGKMREAQFHFQNFQNSQPNSPQSYRNWSFYYVLQKDAEASLTNLEKAIQLGYTDLNWLKTEEAFDVLRDNPRYIALIKSLEERSK